MSLPFPHRRGTVARAAAVLALPLVAACQDGVTRTEPVEDRSAVVAPSITVQCQATLPSGAVTCADHVESAGPSFERRTLGEQGKFVRLNASNGAYAGGVLTFDLAVHNISTLPFATEDGTTPHPSGVQVFVADATVATGTGTAEVATPSGSKNQPFYQYGGKVSGAAQPELGADGILSPGETSAAKPWSVAVPASATTVRFTLYVVTQTPAGTLGSIAPQITAISPSPLVPGGTATITGSNFSTVAAGNTLTIGGRTVVVTAATATSLQFTVPCMSSGILPVHVTVGGTRGTTVLHPLQVAQRAVDVGQAVVLSNAESYCNELPATNAASRYVLAVFSASGSPTSNTPFKISSDELGAEGQAPVNPAGDSEALVRPSTLDDEMENAAANYAEARHLELLEKNRAAYERLRGRFGAGDREGQLRPNRNVTAVEPPVSRNFRVSNINATSPQTICSSYYNVAATRVYYNGKIAIYEDNATPNAFKAALSPKMADYYQKIGDQFNAHMEPILRNNFGDVLRRDGVTDNNGVLIALFTPVINNQFPGVAGFVVSCDQFQNDDPSSPAVGGPFTTPAGSFNGASNHGEVFYALQPTVNANGFSGNTPDNWYRTVRSTFIHEAKHVVSQAARVANNAPTFEASWLEEGTARHSEELWMREAVDNVPWKGNTGYGTAANPINIYCDVRPSGWPECLGNPSRPASIMQRHFTSLNTHLSSTNARLLSPFGPSQSDNGSFFYAISWSLVRYAIDRYAASDAAFFTALTNSTTAGITNLTGRVGQPIDKILGGWALSLAVDDHPALAGVTVSPDIQMPTWNFRSIYAGFRTDFPASFALSYPVVPAPLTFGTFNLPANTTLRGGGVLWYELSGVQTQAQLLRLEAEAGGLPSANLRVAVTRLQ